MAQSLSESTYSPRSGRVRLLFSALRPLLDSELDEKDQIARLLMEQLAVAVFGSGAVGDGFKLLSPAAIPGNENTFTVLPGFGYFQGMLVQLLDPIVVSGLSTPVGPRTDYVYLDWSFVEVDSLTDPTILGLVYPPGGGSPTSPETATRETIEVSIGVAEGVPIPAPPAGTQRIRIASLTRPAANPFINGTVTDERELWRHTYVGEGLRVSSAGAGFDVDVEAGQYWSAGVIRNPIATTVTLPTANTTYYIYADSAGVIGFDSYPPLDAFQVVLAKVQTPAAGPIPDEGILDMRPWQAVHARVEREVMDARGTLPTLSDYLLTEHNPDGTHNLAAVFSGAIDRNNWIDLLPEEDPGGPSLRVYVNPGRYTTPSGERTLDFPGGLSPNFIPPLPIAPNRIDLLTIDDFGALNITQGTPTPLAPTAPIYPEDQMVIAEVTVVYNPMGTDIESADIRDVRPFLNMGYNPALTGTPELYVQIDANTDVRYNPATGQFSLTGEQFTQGDHSLQVYRNGKLLYEGYDYVEISGGPPGIIQLIHFPLGAGSNIFEFIVPKVDQGGGSAPKLFEIQTGAQGVPVMGSSEFTLLTGYYTPSPTAPTIQVYRNGKKLVSGIDFFQTSPNQITLNGYLAAATDIFLFLTW